MLNPLVCQTPYRRCETMKAVMPMSDKMLPTTEVLSNMIITEVLDRWPQTADVFHNHAMACVGCAVAPFFTINDAALVYQLALEQFVEELLVIIQKQSIERKPTNE